MLGEARAACDRESRGVADGGTRVPEVLIYELYGLEVLTVAISVVSVVSAGEKDH